MKTTGPAGLAAQRILVIGGGFSGMSAAIELRKLGAEVDLAEIDPGCPRTTPASAWAGPWLALTAPI